MQKKTRQAQQQKIHTYNIIINTLWNKSPTNYSAWSRTLMIKLSLSKRMHAQGKPLCYSEHGENRNKGKIIIDIRVNNNQRGNNYLCMNH